jgi:hypothetical protein
MDKECLYCGLRFPETTTFCPDCGRPTVSGFKIRPTQKYEVDSLRREIKEKDELIRRLFLFRTRRGEASRAAAHSTGRRGIRGSNGRKEAIERASERSLRYYP